MLKEREKTKQTIEFKRKTATFFKAAVAHFKIDWSENEVSERFYCFSSVIPVPSSKMSS